MLLLSSMKGVMLFLLKLSRIFDYFDQYSMMEMMLSDSQSKDIKGDADHALLAETFMLEPQASSERKPKVAYKGTCWRIPGTTWRERCLAAAPTLPLF